MRPLDLAATHADLSGLREACGVFGVWNDPDAALTTYYGLYALQHRGQESAGIAAAGEDGLAVHVGMGLLGQAFEHVAPSSLAGTFAIGHVRYSTQGSALPENAQPLAARYLGGYLAVCHNGNITNALSLRRELEAEGSIFRSTVDTEVVAHLIARAGTADPLSAVQSALSRLEGAYSILLLTPDGIVAARDPHGLRPLCLGQDGHRLAAASETCALDLVGIPFLREVRPGEMVRLGPAGLESFSIAVSDPADTTPRLAAPPEERLCLFETVYLARPDSRLHGLAVHSMRRRAGARLAEEAPADADLVTGVPDSGLSAAMGYAERSGLPFEMGLMRNRYASRTFIQPTDRLRGDSVRLKLSALDSVVRDRRVVVVDDSVVRGTTSRRIVNLLREAGAREVHVRVASPPVRFACHYGIDTGRPGELIAARLDLESLRAEIGADSLAFLSREGLLQAGQGPEGQLSGYCDGCFSGHYPTRVDRDRDKFGIERELLTVRADQGPAGKAPKP